MTPVSQDIAPTSCRDLSVPALLVRLASRRPLFHSEADFQHALAWQLHLDYPDVAVRLERRPDPKLRQAADLWITDTRGDSLVAELKYLVRAIDVTIDHERFVLANQGAHDLSRYDVVKDLTRVEGWVQQGLAVRGLVIVLTNDPSYWHRSVRATIDADFRLHNGRELTGRLAWSDHAGEGTTRGRTAELVVQGRYTVRWAAYSMASHASPVQALVLETTAESRGSLAPRPPSGPVPMESPGGPRSSEGSDAAVLADTFLQFCPSPDALLTPDGYRDSALALIDAIFSMQARYEGARRVVRNYARWAGLPDTPGLPISPTAADEHSLDDLRARLVPLSGVQAAVTVFENRSKHARSGRLKAQLVIDAATGLVDVGVFGRQQVALSPLTAAYEQQKQAWTHIRGLGPVTFEYFRMLCGAESAKPDIMITRWLEQSLGRTSSWRDALMLIAALTDELSARWGVEVSQRSVDHTIWRQQSGRTLDPEAPVAWRADLEDESPPAAGATHPKTARQEILEVARDLTNRGLTPFSPKQIIDELHLRGTRFPDSTLRTYIVSAMCSNAPTNHATTYPDLRRVGRGQYVLNGDPPVAATAQ